MESPNADDYSATEMPSGVVEQKVIVKMRSIETEYFRLHSTKICLISRRIIQKCLSKCSPTASISWIAQFLKNEFYFQTNTSNRFQFMVSFFI